MNVYAFLAAAALLLHGAWLLWVLLGWLVTRHRPWLRALHIGSLFYAILIEVFLWPCPLTLAEQYFLRRAGLASYQESFLLHYLQGIVYPDISQTVLTAGAVAVCLALLGIHGRRFRQRSPTGW